MPEAFGTWLLKQRGRDDSVGDLARVFKQDTEINNFRPSSIRTPSAMKRHLRAFECCDGAEIAFYQAENEYQMRQ